MAYITSAAGETSEVVITLSVSGASGDLVVPALQDITVNNSNDLFTWSQLDEGSKLQVATTSTNSIACNIVLDETTFFGNATATTDSAENKGLLGLSDTKQLTAFSINVGANKTLSGNCYVTGLAPAVSADAPVWTSPVTLSVSGEYTVA